MSSLSSPVKKIEDLEILPLKDGKIREGSRVVIVDGTAVVIDGTTIYTNGVQKHAHYCLGQWPWHNKLMKALKSSGVITAEQFEQHMTAARRAEFRNQYEWREKNAHETAKYFGYSLTAEQVNAIAVFKKNGPPAADVEDSP